MTDKPYKPPIYSAITPHLVVSNALEAMDWYDKVFGIERLMHMPGPAGEKSTMHALITIGGATIMLVDEFPDMGALSPKAIGGTPVTIHHYTPDVDAVYQRAVDHGAEGKMPPSDMFWGDRYGKFVDPFGHEWSVATMTEKIGPEEIKKRQEDWHAQFGAGDDAGC